MAKKKIPGYRSLRPKSGRSTSVRSSLSSTTNGGGRNDGSITDIQLSGTSLIVSGINGAFNGTVDLSSILSGAVSITSIDVKPTANPNEITVDIVWVDSNGVTQTTSDATPITIDITSTSFGESATDYDSASATPAQPLDAPTVSLVAGNNHIEFYDNGVGYFTYDGTDWNLDSFKEDTGNVTSFLAVNAAYDLLSLPPAGPTNPPLSSSDGDTIIQRFTNGLAYFTFDGTDWVLNLFESNDDRKFTHRDESALTYVEGSLAGPQNPPANPNNLDVHMERYDNALVFFNYLDVGGWDGANVTFVPFAVSQCAFSAVPDPQTVTFSNGGPTVSDEFTFTSLGPTDTDISWLLSGDVPGGGGYVAIQVGTAPGLSDIVDEVANGFTLGDESSAGSGGGSFAIPAAGTYYYRFVATGNMGTLSTVNATFTAGTGVADVCDILDDLNNRLAVTQSITDDISHAPDSQALIDDVDIDALLADLPDGVAYHFHALSDPVSLTSAAEIAFAVDGSLSIQGVVEPLDIPFGAQGFISRNGSTLTVHYATTSSDEHIAQVGLAAAIGSAAPAGIKTGHDPLTGESLYVDNNGDWQLDVSVKTTNITCLEIPNVDASADTGVTRNENVDDIRFVAPFDGTVSSFSFKLENTSAATVQRNIVFTDLGGATITADVPVGTSIVTYTLPVPFAVVGGTSYAINTQQVSPFPVNYFTADNLNSGLEFTSGAGLIVAGATDAGYVQTLREVECSDGSLTYYEGDTLLIGVTTRPSGATECVPVDEFGTVMTATTSFTSTNGVKVPVDGFYNSFPDGTTWATPSVAEYNEFINNYGPKYIALSYEAAGGASAIINVNGVAATYKDLVNASDTGTGQVNFSSGTNGSFNRLARVDGEVLKDVGDYIEISGVNVASFSGMQIAVLDNETDFAHTSSNVYKFLSNAGANQNVEGYSFRDLTNAVVASGGETNATYRITKTLGGISFERNGVELYCTEVTEFTDYRNITSTVDGQTGAYRLSADKPNTPVAIANTNDTNVVTGHDLTQASDMYLKISYADATGAHQWGTLEYPVDDLIARFNNGEIQDGSGTVFSTGFVRINIINPATGEINLIDSGREMSYVSSELWVAAVNKANSVVTATQSSGTVSSAYTLSFPVTIPQDPDGWKQTNNQDFVVPSGVSGRFSIKASITTSGVSANDDLSASISVTPLATGVVERPATDTDSNNTAGARSVSLSADVDLVEGDIIQLTGFASSAQTVNRARLTITELNATNVVGGSIASSTIYTNQPLNSDAHTKQVFDWAPNSNNVRNGYFKVTDDTTSAEHKRTIYLREGETKSIYIMGPSLLDATTSYSNLILGNEIEVSVVNGEVVYQNADAASASRFISTTTPVADFAAHAWDDFDSNGGPSAMTQAQFDEFIKPQIEVLAQANTAHDTIPEFTVGAGKIENVLDQFNRSITRVEDAAASVTEISRSADMSVTSFVEIELERDASATHGCYLRANTPGTGRQAQVRISLVDDSTDLNNSGANTALPTVLKTIVGEYSIKHFIQFNDPVGHTDLEFCAAGTNAALAPTPAQTGITGVYGIKLYETNPV